jgi:tetratricopeptide (TPR) repeat protein
MNIEDLIIELSHKPFNPELNFQCAVKYEQMNQTASAVSFYLRTAEYGYDKSPSLVYASLCKLAECFEHQKDRAWTVSNCLLQAVQYLPYRPEAYFLLSRFYERAQQWQESYTWAELGLERDDGRGFHDAPDHDYFPSLPVDVGYLGRSVLEFQKALAAYWIGRAEESKKIMMRLSQTDLPTEYQRAIEENLERLNAVI